MIATITHRIEVDTNQKLTALRDRLAALLNEDEDTTLISSSQAQDTRTFTIYGVDTQTSEPFTEQVEATDRDAATSEVETQTKVVAQVIEG